MCCLTEFDSHFCIVLLLGAAGAYARHPAVVVSACHTTRSAMSAAVCFSGWIAAIHQVQGSQHDVAFL